MRFGMFTYICRYGRYFAGFFHNAETVQAFCRA